MLFNKRVSRYAKNKFNAVKTSGGFSSKLEAAVYNLLKLREKSGEISEIKQQQTVVLQDGPRNTRITWRVDFSFYDLKTGQTTYAEAKGVETQEYKLKLKLWRKLKPANLEIWKGNYTRPILVELITTNEECDNATNKEGTHD